MLKRLFVAFAFLFTSAALGTVRGKAINPAAFSGSPGSWYAPMGIELKIDGALRMTPGQLNRQAGFAMNTEVLPEIWTMGIS